MADSFLEKAEEGELFRQKIRDNSTLIFASQGSAGRNPEKLAKILSAFDLVINIFGWQEKPLANLTSFLTQYQASVDAKYHNDFKDVQVAEEIERKRAERKGLSIING